MSHAPEERVGRERMMAVADDLYAGLAAAQRAIAGSGIETGLIEIVKIRVSQRNGCAFCVEMHCAAALKADVGYDKLLLIPVWNEAGAMFSARERAALAWADAVCNVAEQENISDGIYDVIKTQFEEREIVYLTGAIAMISAWNRIAKPLRFALTGVLSAK